MSDRNQEKTNKHAFIRKIIIALCLVVMITTGGVLLWNYISQYNSSQKYTAMQKQVLSREEPVEREGSRYIVKDEVEEVGEFLEIAEVSEVPADSNMQTTVDFEALWKENEHIYAWITIPDTNVNYPVLQHPTDDTYYLNYNVDGSKGYPGCIYTEKINAKDFSDFNTLIYGHNMKNGSMFHDLHQYKKDGFREGHPYVYVYLPERTLKFQIVATYQFDDRHILYSFDFSKENVRDSYIADIRKKADEAVLEELDMLGITLDSDSDIITMATCVSGTNYRYLVQAVLIEDIAVEAHTD